MASIVWRVTIRLTGIMPIVWRTILVRPETKLAQFHRYLQAAMGWLDCHLYMFTIDGKSYAVPRADLDIGKKVYDARRYTLARLFPQLPARCDYVYDFGDDWKHRIEIEGEQPAEYRKQYPICVAGAEPCPPENIGGPPGYREFLRILRNPNDPMHAEVAEVVAMNYYSREFSIRTATWTMRDVQRGLY